MVHLGRVRPRKGQRTHLEATCPNANDYPIMTEQELAMLKHDNRPWVPRYRAGPGLLNGSSLAQAAGKAYSPDHALHASGCHGVQVYCRIRRAQLRQENADELLYKDLLSSLPVPGLGRRIWSGSL